MKLFKSDEVKFSTSLAVSTHSNDVIETMKQDAKLSIAGKEVGKEEMMLHLAGVPVKRVDVQVLSDFKVIPGGQSIGVKLNSKGVLVVGYHQVDTKDGKKSPGEIAGIQVGDMITKINGKTIEKMSDITPFIQQAGKTGEPLKLQVMREKEQLQTKLYPLKDKEDYAYRIGLYIRDSAAGIGTMTFYDPKSKNMER